MPQYTKCVEAKDFPGWNFATAPLFWGLGYGFMGALAGLGIFLGASGWIGLLLGLSASGGGYLLIAHLIAGFAYGFAEGMCTKYLEKRLVCIAKDQCIIGVVSDDPHEPEWITEDMDNDYTFYVSLTPHKIEDSYDNVINDGFQGTQFVKPSPIIEGHGLNYRRGNRDRTLHCEIEGGRAKAFCDTLKALSPFIGLAAAGCIAGFFVACLILLALLAYVAIVYLTGGHDPSPEDVAVDAASGSLDKGDHVIVFGDHIYDGGHSDSWNELHPVKHLQKLSKNSLLVMQYPNAPVPYDLTVDPMKTWSSIRKLWCEQVAQGKSALTGNIQKQPINRWRDHPLVDGCDEPDYEMPK